MADSVKELIMGWLPHDICVFQGERSPQFQLWTLLAPEVLTWLPCVYACRWPAPTHHIEPSGPADDDFFVTDCDHTWGDHVCVMASDRDHCREGSRAVIASTRRSRTTSEGVPGRLFTSREEVESDDGFEHTLVFFYRCSVPAAFLAENAPCLKVGDGVFDGGADFAERGVEFGLAG